MPFVVAVALRAPTCEAFGNAWVDFGVGVAARGIMRAVNLHQFIHLLWGVVGQHIAEAIDKMQADETAQVFECQRTAPGGLQGLLNRSADIARGIEQRSVDIEEIGRGITPAAALAFGESRDAAAGLWADYLLRVVGGILRARSGLRGQIAALMICITSLPSRISRSSRASAIVTSASECSSMYTSAVS